MPEFAAARAATPLSVTMTPVTGPTDQVDAPQGVQAGDMLVAIISGTAAQPTIAGGNPWLLQDQRGGPGEWTTTLIYAQVAGVDNPTSYGIVLNPLTVTSGLVTLVHLRNATPAGLLLVSNAGGSGPAAITPATSAGAAGGIELRYVVGGGLTAPTWTPGGTYTLQDQAAHGPLLVAWAGANILLSSAALETVAIPATPSLFGWQAWTLVVLPADYVPPQPPTPAFTPAKGSALYRYTAHDLLSGQYIDDIYPRDVTFDKRIGEPGAFAGTLPIPNRRVATAVRRVIPRFKSDLSTGPGRIEIRIWRDGVLQPRYWLTGARLSFGRDGKIAVELRGSTLDAYPFSVRVRQDLSYSGDQVANVRSLLQHAQTQPGADIGILFQTGSTGVTRPLMVKAGDGTSYGRAAQEYAKTSGGFESVLNETVGPSGVESTWTWGYPKLGTGTTHLFTSSPHGGEVAEWGLDIDALKGGTDLQVRGGTPETDATEDRQPIYSGMVTTPHRAAGWPRNDRLVDHPNQSVDQTTLDMYAQHMADSSGGALWVRTVTVFLGKHSSLTMQKLGDYARLVLTDVWHEREDGGAGLDVSERIIGIQIRPPQKGRGKEEATLILESPEVT